MDLYDYNTIKRILTRHGFTFSKALGQNFLIDPSVCPRMAAALEADDRTGVLEIGPGIGVLTKELSAVCGRVAAVELDRRLPDVLAETLADCPNVQVVPGDVLQMDLQALFADQFAGCDRLQVCANLPYYITTPVLMRLLEGELPIERLVVMCNWRRPSACARPWVPGTAVPCPQRWNTIRRRRSCLKWGERAFSPAPM